MVTTDRPTIIGLLSLRDLDLESIHCAIQKTPNPINFTSELTNSYPDQFDHIGHFKGEYHIVLKHQPSPRKCPIHMRGEIKGELENMEIQGTIRRVCALTEWVSSVVYVQKSNEKLCLDHKNNRAIMRCYYKTPTLKELAHNLSDAQYFSKVDTKNGYWSIKLDTKSQLLTTFYSPFERFCF